MEEWQDIEGYESIIFDINYSTLKSWLKNNKRGNRFEYYEK